MPRATPRRWTWPSRRKGARIVVRDGPLPRSRSLPEGRTVRGCPDACCHPASGPPACLLRIGQSGLGSGVVSHAPTGSAQVTAVRYPVERSPTPPGTPTGQRRHRTEACRRRYRSRWCCHGWLQKPRWSSGPRRVIWTLRGRSAAWLRICAPWSESAGSSRTSLCVSCGAGNAKVAACEGPTLVGRSNGPCRALDTPMSQPLRCGPRNHVGSLPTTAQPAPWLLSDTAHQECRLMKPAPVVAAAQPRVRPRPVARHRQAIASSVASRRVRARAEGGARVPTTEGAAPVPNRACQVGLARAVYCVECISGG